jgi:hypothetical protein
LVKKLFCNALGYQHPPDLFAKASFVGAKTV